MALNRAMDRVANFPLPMTDPRNDARIVADGNARGLAAIGVSHDSLHWHDRLGRTDQPRFRTGLSRCLVSVVPPPEERCAPISCVRSRPVFRRIRRNGCNGGLLPWLPSIRPMAGGTEQAFLERCIGMSRSIWQRLASDETACVMSMGAFPDPKLVEVAGRIAKIDGIWIDQEHSGITQRCLEMLLIACRAVGLDAFARVAPTDYPTIMRPMEAGCSGVMVAQIRTLAQVEQVVRWSKYPPVGERGLFIGNAESRYGTVAPAEHVTRANRERWLAIQIETVEAIDLAESIARTDGVDLLFVGPGDLACCLGVPGEAMHPKCVDALQHVSAACANAGVPWGALSRDPVHAEYCRKLGCQLFSLMSDMDIVHRGVSATHHLFDTFFDE